jgi:hypothetical protein
LGDYQDLLHLEARQAHGLAPTGRGPWPTVIALHLVYALQLEAELDQDGLPANPVAESCPVEAVWTPKNPKKTPPGAPSKEPAVQQLLWRTAVAETACPLQMVACIQYSGYIQLIRSSW